MPRGTARTSSSQRRQPSRIRSFRAPFTPLPRRSRRPAAARSRAPATFAPRTRSEAVDKAVATFGGIDVLVNNASAISLTGTLQTPMKRYDLMHHQHARHLRLLAGVHAPDEAENPHILNLSPPLGGREDGSRPHVAYDGEVWHEHVRARHGRRGFARGSPINALWPRTVIATAAVQNLLGGAETVRGSRTPQIMADAAHVILTSEPGVHRELLHRRRSAPVGGRDRLRPVPEVVPGADLIPDFFVLIARFWGDPLPKPQRHPATHGRRRRGGVKGARSSTTSGRSCARQLAARH